MSDILQLTDLEKKRLKKLQHAANEYYEAREAHQIQGIKLAQMANRVFGDFEKFWAPIRKRESFMRDWVQCAETWAQHCPELLGRARKIPEAK